MSATAKKILFPLITSLTFAGSFVAGKYAIMDLGPLTTTFLRYLVALAFLACLLPRQGRAGLKIDRKDLPRLILLGLFGIVGYHFFFFSSLRYTEVANTAIINALTPVVTGMLAATFIGERLSLRNYLGVLIATAGVIVLVTRGSVERLIGLDFNLGDGLMFLAVINWATYSLIVKRLSKKYSGVTITLYSALFGTAILLPLSLTESLFDQLQAITTRSLLSILYMGAVASGIGYLLYNLSIDRIGPTRTSCIVHSVVPVVVTTLALIFFDEPVTAVIVISAVMIVAGLNFVLGKKN